MSHADDIAAALERWKSEGRSSPSGGHWHRFWTWLNENKPVDATKPPPPLILGASGASHASKHRRLGEQLKWADAYGLALHALTLLDALPPDSWNIGDSRRWHEDYWP